MLFEVAIARQWREYLIHVRGGAVRARLVPEPGLPGPGLPAAVVILCQTSIKPVFIVEQSCPDHAFNPCRPVIVVVGGGGGGIGDGLVVTFSGTRCQM